MNRNRHRGILAFALLAALAGPATAAEIIEATPRIRRDAAELKESAALPPVTAVYSAPPRPALDPYRERKLILRLDYEAETVMVNVPFRVLVRAYDSQGLPDPRCQELVTFESLHGVVPVVSQARWKNGLLEDTVVITRPGKNVRLAAIAGDAVAALHLDVHAPLPDSAGWVRIAAERLAERRVEDAIAALKNASSLTPLGDPAIEKRIARLYLERGMWREAEEHYRRALRAITGTPLR